MGIFKCDICWFDGKSHQSLIRFHERNSCGKHNRRKIINVKKYRICEMCEEIATHSGDRTPLRCLWHKFPTDCLSKAQRCIVDDCKKQPFYGCEYRRKRERCGIHKLKSDTNLNSKI